MKVRLITKSDRGMQIKGTVKEYECKSMSIDDNKIVLNIRPNHDVIWTLTMCDVQVLEA